MVRGSQYKYTNCILSSTTVSQWCQWKFTQRLASLSWTIYSLLRSQLSSSLFPSFRQLLIPVSWKMHFYLFPAACWKQPAVMQKCVQGGSWAWECFRLLVAVVMYLLSPTRNHAWKLFPVTSKSKKMEAGFYVLCPWIWPTGYIFISLVQHEEKQTCCSQYLDILIPLALDLFEPST